jgi:hypothetical protein
MRLFFGGSLFLLGCVSLLAQAPAPTGASAAPPAQTATPAPLPAIPPSAAAAPLPAQVEDGDVGFSYNLPSDWEYVAPPQAPKIVVPYPDVVGAKKGDACVQVALTAKHGAPASVVVVLALPFACYGQTMKTSDLANFGAGAAEGLKQTFDVTDPVQGNYTLGDHNIWIERAKGTPKGHPENSFTFEVACTLLTKGAACWMTMATDWPNLRAFERAPVTLDGDTFAALVPPHSFVHDPK